jgi:hypothetical protein
MPWTKRHGYERGKKAPLLLPEGQFLERHQLPVALEHLAAGKDDCIHNEVVGLAAPAQFLKLAGLDIGAFLLRAVDAAARAALPYAPAGRGWRCGRY